MASSPRARVALIGLGPIGIEVGRALVPRSDIDILGAADPMPDKFGRELEDVLGMPASLAGIGVSPSARVLYEASSDTRSKNDVAIICTGSRLPSIANQIDEAIEAGFHIVSTCEELAYPQLTQAALAHHIDRKAKEKGVAVLGTGVNPGLVMDRLVLEVASACVSIDRVLVTRVVDAAKRRGPLRAKVGAGLTRKEFEEGVAARQLGHVGLSESAAIIAHGLGLPTDEITETIRPVIATVETDGIEPGRVLGLHQIAIVQAGDKVRVTLDLTMAVGVVDPADRIEIEGDPPISLVVSGGFHGDRATVGCVVNAIPFIVQAPPGLHNVVTLPLFGLVPLLR